MNYYTHIFSELFMVFFNDKGVNYDLFNIFHYFKLSFTAYFDSLYNF